MFDWLKRKPATKYVVMSRKEYEALPPGTIIEAFNVQPDDDADEDDWNPTDSRGDVLKRQDRIDARDEIRWLAKHQSHVRRALRLYQLYIFGKEFKISIDPKDPKDVTEDKFIKARRSTEASVAEFLQFNFGRWSLQELGLRFYRDGEVFSRKEPAKSETIWPPKIGFVDPEDIGEDKGEEGDQGIIVKDGDVTDIMSYRKIDPITLEEVEMIPADEMFYAKDNADSTEKRGLTRFFSAIDNSKDYKGNLKNETLHRKLQSSLVAVRTVKGSPAKAQSHMDNLKTGTTKYLEATRNREKFRGGSILTVNESVAFDFKQPESNFSDASPLFKLLMQDLSACTGWPYFMLSMDSGDANFAASLVQESPVNVMVEGEQEFHRLSLTPLFRWVIEMAISAGKIDGYKKVDPFWKKYTMKFFFPTMISADNLKEGQRVNLAIGNHTMSPQEGSRQQNLDPEKMKQEIQSSQEDAIGMSAVAAMNTPGISRPQSQTGGNQGDDGNQPGGDDETQIARRSKQSR